MGWIFRILLTVAVSAIALSAQQQPREVLNGTTLLMHFDAKEGAGVVEYGRHTYPLLRHPLDAGEKIALIPVGYRSEPGEKTLFLRHAKQHEKLSIQVIAGNYPSESITVEPSKVTLSPSDAERTAREYREAMAIYETFTPKRYWKKPFIVPMESAITSRFGTARTYNGQLKSYHSGSDFKAPIGEAVAAVNDGRVVLAKPRYYAGNSVVVDHGEGLYSCYYHLSRMDVKPGDVVRRGERVGLSGQSGRVTGPHLHFAVMLYGVQVNPLQLIETVNTLF